MVNKEHCSTSDKCLLTIDIQKLTAVATVRCAFLVHSVKIWRGLPESKVMKICGMMQEETGLLGQNMVGY